MQSSTKIAYLETIRGLACLSVVFYHAVGSTPQAGLEFPPGHFFHIFNDLLAPARMPLFAFVSGLLFASAVTNFDEWRHKIADKVQRLLVPLFVVGTLHFLIQSMVTRPSLSYLETFYLGYDHFWFLQAMFVLMAVHLTLSWMLGGRAVAAAQILAAVTVAMQIFLDRSQFPLFSIDEAIFLGPFFFGGYVVRYYLGRTAEKEAAPPRRAVLPILTLATLVAYSVELAIVLQAITVSSTIRDMTLLIAGALTCAVLFFAQFRAKWLTVLGEMSYAIYLFHVFFTAGSREVLQKLLPDTDPWLLLIPVFAAGVIGPMVVYWLSLRHPVPALLFLGIGPKRKPERERETTVAPVDHSGAPRGGHA